MAHRTENRVLETTTTTGTGALALSGAVTGFRSFSGAGLSSANPDTCYYEAWGVDSNGNATGEYEAGLGTYSAANTLTRTTVYDSSNSGSAVSFSAGTKYVALSMLAQGYRPCLTSTLASDYTNSTTSFSNVTGLAFDVEANATYEVEVVLTMQSAATTTGISLAFTVPTLGGAVGTFFHQLANTGTLTAGSQITGGAAAGITSGVPAATTNLPIFGKWIVTTGSNSGTVQLQAKSEVASSAVTLKANLCYLKATRIK
jgi:hypothetical protein